MMKQKREMLQRGSQFLLDKKYMQMLPKSSDMRERELDRERYLKHHYILKT